ncbi:hypothetical protein H8959_004130 [Pygathrix nigripes]
MQARPSHLSSLLLQLRPSGHLDPMSLKQLARRQLVTSGAPVCAQPCSGESLCSAGVTQEARGLHWAGTVGQSPASRAGRGADLQWHFRTDVVGVGLGLGQGGLGRYSERSESLRPLGTENTESCIRQCQSTDSGQPGGPERGAAGGDGMHRLSRWLTLSPAPSLTSPGGGWTIWERIPCSPP